MSQPVPLNPGTDITMEAKLNQLCEKCSSIADHVPLFRKSCSIDPDNPTVYWINHHESSNALITSARAGCHLCTLLLAKIEDAQAQELEFGIMDERSGRQAQLNYQIKLSGNLQQRFDPNEDFGSWTYESNEFDRSDVDRHVSIEIFRQISKRHTRRQVARNTHPVEVTTRSLDIEYQTGKSMTYRYRSFYNRSQTGNEW